MADLLKPLAVWRWLFTNYNTLDNVVSYILEMREMNTVHHDTKPTNNHLSIQLTKRDRGKLENI